MNATYQKLLSNISPNAAVLKSEVYGTVVAFRPSQNNRFILTVIESFKSKKPKIMSANDEEQVYKYFVRLVESEERLAKQRAQWNEQKKVDKANFLANLKVGSILHGSWGYEQTNCEFYRVIELNGTKVKIQELPHISTKETSWASCNVMPNLEDTSGTILERTVASASIKLNSSCDLYIWDGKEKYSSWYY